MQDPHAHCSEEQLPELQELARNGWEGPISTTGSAYLLSNLGGLLKLAVDCVVLYRDHDLGSQESLQLSSIGVHLVLIFQ